MSWNYREKKNLGPQTVSFVERLSLFQSVHCWYFTVMRVRVSNEGVFLCGCGPFSTLHEGVFLCGCGPFNTCACIVACTALNTVKILCFRFLLQRCHKPC